MAEQKLPTTGSMLGRALEAPAVAELASTFAGELVQPHDPGYDRAPTNFFRLNQNIRPSG